MYDTAEDSALPDALRRASHDTGARAHAFDGVARSLGTARSSLYAAPGVFAGPCANRFQATLDGLAARFLTARAVHEEIADALRQTVAPIQEEQRTREALRRAKERLTDAERLLAAERTKAAEIEAAGAPSDRTGVARAEREVEEAEAGVLRARRRHEEADQERQRVVRALTTACRAATVFGPPPAAPGVTAGGAVVTTLLGPRLQDQLYGKEPRSLGRRPYGRGATPQELRRLARNGMSPREPLFSLLHTSRSASAAVRQGKGWAFGHREYMVSAGAGRIGSRYGVRLDGRAAAYALKVGTEKHLRAGPVHGKIGLDGRIGGGEVSGGTDINFGKDGARAAARAEAFAGARAGVDLQAGAGPLKAGVKPEGMVGIGASLGFDVGYQDGKLKFKGALGAVFGFGGKVTGSGEIDVLKLADGIGDGAKALAGLFR